MFLVVPEVESSDGAEQQQHGPGDEHGDPDLQQAAGGGRLDGHGRVGLRWRGRVVDAGEQH